ncbi:NAD(P)/FAD-dependent oxidoreductase [Woeseia oceani]|uniref:FAD dependent oxidoreductase domain-containing protein n=1 Tax=Woeseia oceani TaxID=1548547 RepID=A0A193LDG7_9GAMM|nr:NAD(P)/FAD-dependent oxidoreductase [Woeseia oceani]ANO50523.1 hypothetical protein BA177_04220 [Woeseia oceani]
MADVRLVVVGAGVIGLAVAREAAMRGIETIVLEAGTNIGSETSSRNSEVIHGGIYYAAGSLKALHCLAGRKRLYRYAEERNIPFSRCGKLIVANSEGEDSVLRGLLDRSIKNGLTGDDALRYLNAREVNRLEPNVHAVSALLSPSTGIIDSHSLMLAMQADAEAAGADLVLRSRVDQLVPGAPHTLSGNNDGDEWQLTADNVVVSAGLHSTHLMQGNDWLRPLAPQVRMVKGNYFALSGKSPFRHLVYPVPVEKGLGIHATLDLSGSTRFGPDTEDVVDIDYRVDERRQAVFESSIRRYWPDLPADRLLPAYAGIRPKVQLAGAEADFLIQGPDELATAGLAFLHGIESPGLTASLSLASSVCDRLSLT